MVASCRHLTRMIHASGSHLGRGDRGGIPLAQEYLAMSADSFGCHNLGVQVGQDATAI